MPRGQRSMVFLGLRQRFLLNGSEKNGEKIIKCLYTLLATLSVLLFGFSPSSSQASSTLKTNECIRKVVYAEARGESKLGQRAVAHVILNRARSSSRTVCVVVSQPGQFRFRNAPKSFNMPKLGKDPTNGATHFRTKDMPVWLGLKKKIRIGNHTFYGN